MLPRLMPFPSDSSQLQHQSVWILNPFQIDPSHPCSSNAFQELQEWLEQLWQLFPCCKTTMAASCESAIRCYRSRCQIQDGIIHKRVLIDNVSRFNRAQVVFQAVDMAGSTAITLHSPHPHQICESRATRGNIPRTRESFAAMTR